MSNAAVHERPDFTADEGRAFGRSLRDRISRSEHGIFEAKERDPVAILEEQNATRLQGLVPVRIGRMLESPFSYYRGTAAVMAHDLAGTAVTGHDAVICGDAHISNFGLFASPERRVLFDLNDFDEASIGPWEWDVKRLAASAYIGARDNGFSEDEASDAARTSARAYREAIRKLCDHSAVERFFFQVDADWLEHEVTPDGRKVLKETVAKATKRTSEQVLTKITVAGDGGGVRIKDQPPIMMHVDHATEEDMQRLYAEYLTTLRSDAAMLLSQFKLVDWVLRVVGVGSVGTRCYVLMLTGPSGIPLFLQAKEAPPSVLQTYGGIPDPLPPTLPRVEHGQEGYRVVASQRILQAQSDPFLGWVGGFAGESSARRGVDYYWRQFRDMKGSVDVRALTPSQFANYCGLCGGLLARAHSQSPGSYVIQGYLGKSDVWDGAIAGWSKSYADQVEQDYALAEKAAAQGRLPVTRGL